MTDVAPRHAKLTIFLTEDDRSGHHLTCDVLLERAREDGLLGATVWRGVEGFGRSGRMRSARFIDTGLGSPLALELIDTPDRIEEFLGVVAEIAPKALVTREPVEMRADPKKREGALDDAES